MTEVSRTKPLIRTDRLKLLGLFAVAGVPVVLAMVMYFGQIGVPMSRTNHGELVLPPLNAAELVAVDQSLDTPNQWTLVTVGSGPCGKDCQASLYKIQQVNVALGRDANRVRHMLWAPDQSEQELATLRGQYPDLQVRQVNQAQVDAVFQPAPNLAFKGFDIFVVDPLGNLMMRYSSEQSGNEMLDDLKKLLRVSKIG